MKQEWRCDRKFPSVADYMAAILNVEDAAEEMDLWKKKSEDDDYSLVSMTSVRNRVKKYRNHNIHVVGDYDVDGKCALAIIVRTLRYLGHMNVTWRIPRRFSEGYGLNEEIIDEIPDGKTLIITVDNGIAAHEAIAKAVKRGFEVVVTDHHLPVTEEGRVILPQANEIIDPNAIEDSADFTGYCGAGIAYKLALFLLENAGVSDRRFEEKLLTLAAIATVADSVPMIQENHVFVRKGTELLSEGKTFPGLSALMDLFSITGHVTEGDIGYKLGPALNADNRLSDTSTLAIDLLLEDDPEKAREYAERMKEMNELRKNLCAEAEAFADKVITHYAMQEDFPLVVNLGTNIGEGLIGIIAGRLAEKYQIPAIVFCETGDNVLKGSARTYGGIDIHGIISHAKRLLERFGGHPAACGLTVRKENYREMREILKSYCVDFLDRPAKEGVGKYDIEIREEDAVSSIEDLKRFAPYGEALPEPVFRLEMTCAPRGGKYFYTMAREGVKLSGQTLTAVGFGFSNDFEGLKPKDVILYGNLSENYFRGQVSPQMVFLDVEIGTEYSFTRNVTPLSGRFAG